MNRAYYDDLARKYRERGALIDTNLLLLYLVGQCDSAQIERFKRTKKYTNDDFNIMVNIFNFFKKIVTTPNILTEVSNVSNQLAEPLRSEYFRYVAQQVHLLEEHFYPSASACQHPYFTKCGLTDAAIMSLCVDDYLVITDDFELAQRLGKLNLSVLNFNHIRSAYLFSD